MKLLFSWQVLAKSFAGACQDLLFPPCCLGCGTRLERSRLPLFCPQCLAAIQPLRSPCCSVCGAPFAGAGEDHACGSCLRGECLLDRARAAFVYQTSLAQAIHGLKYGRRTQALNSFAHLVAAHGGPHDLPRPDLVLPVPLHPRRLRERGFNQALELARCCLPNYQPLLRDDLLVRQRDAPPQALLHAEDRRRNVAQAFALTAGDEVGGLSLLLVDDVMTTGATLNACARVLRAAGAQRVFAWTLARTP